MKKSIFNRFAPDRHALVLPLASSLLLSITAMGGTINEMTTGNNFGIGPNWSLASAPVGNANPGSHTDLLFTTSSTTLVHSGTMLYAESYNVTNGSSYIIRSTRLTDPATSTTFRIGSTGSTTSPPATFTNAVVAAVDPLNPLLGPNDLVYLSNNSNLTFDGVNGVEGGLAPVLDLRLTTGNFNISAGSTLAIGMNLIGASKAIVVNGNGTTVLSGNNTYSGTTTVRGGTLEIAGTNTGSSYTINGLVNPSEPVLKLSNVNALPTTAVLAGSNSVSYDGIVDLSVAGAYTFDVYNRGNITFTASSGSATSLHFTGASLITSGSNTGRIFNNGSGNLAIVFDSTLDMGGDVVANVVISSTGSTTVTGAVLSTGLGVRSLTKSGSGTVALNGASAYTGTTTVSAGVLRLNHATALPGGVGATGGTSSLIFGGSTGVIGLTAATGDFLRALGAGVDQVTANPNAVSGEGQRMGFAAYGGDRMVDFGTSFSLSSTSHAGGGLALGAVDADSKVILVNNINLASSPRIVTVNDGSAAVDAELSGVISSPTGSLSKRGAGTLLLTGTNTYGGGTTVLAGTLAVDGNSLDDSGELVIDGGKVDLTGAETVNTLFFGGVQQIAGTWGSSTSSALPAFQDDTRFSGTGVVVVTTGPGAGNDYTTWATSFGLENPWVTLGNPALNGEATADPDGDGVTNKQEYAFGLNPTSGASSNPITAQLNKTTGKFSYTRRATPASTGLAYTVTTSTDLVAWPIDVAATTSGQAVTGTAGGVETVEVTLTGAPLTAPKLFVRMEAE